MKAKEFFRDIKKLENEIESKKFMAETYRNLAEGVRSPSYSDMPKSPNRNLDPLASALIKAMELEDEVQTLNKQLILLKGEAMDMIIQLEKDYQIVLIKRYFEKLSWGEIAIAMYYTERWIYKLHGKALIEMDKLFS